MGRLKIDNRIRILIENCIRTRHRSMFVIVGNKGRDLVPILYHILTKATVSSRPSVLWCYKKELGFNSHRKKRIKELKKKVAAGIMHAKEDDPFELFISSTEVRYCYYSETQKILGNTFGMLILQDFEALTPNLLARTVETVEGGGSIVFLLQNIASLRQLYTLTMDVHNRYRTEVHSDIVPRFNERFILSLANCKTCLAIDDRLNIIPISSHTSEIKPISAQLDNNASLHESELKILQNEMSDTLPFNLILKKCKTFCQANAVLKLLDVATNKSIFEICSITAARGRGKSAALGLAIAGAIFFKFTNVFVTSPAPENLKTLFEFVIKGLEALNYKEHADFEVVKSNEAEFNKCVVRINVFRDHRQIIQYILPSDVTKLCAAELVIVDEAAAIPMPLINKLISGNYLVFLASTINGYEGTGRSLSLKLLEKLRQQVNVDQNILKELNGLTTNSMVLHKKLHEIELEESIRYNSGDHVEEWLNKILCLNCVNLSHTILNVPPPDKCKLYYVNRDTLFSFHNASETFLANMMSIYVSAHYKNSPNDLQMLSDAPSHHLFVLMAPVQTEQTSAPQILAVLQICLEGAISSQKVNDSLKQGKRAAGDLIPWTISQQLLDNNFPLLKGARIVRLAVHPDYQNMGYGSQAIKLLVKFYQKEFWNLNETNLMENHNDNNIEDENVNLFIKQSNDANLDITEEVIEPRSNLPPLLMRLNERIPEELDYLGVSFGLTLNLLKFWKRLDFVPVYLRQGVNDLTGEHTCIVLSTIKSENKALSKSWLNDYFNEFKHRFIPLLSFTFSKFTPHLAISLMDINITNKSSKLTEILDRNKLSVFLSNTDLKRLAEYARNMVDYTLIIDLLPIIATLYFDEKINFTLDVRQAAVLLSVGLQKNSIEQTARNLNLLGNQIYALLNKAIRQFSEYFDSICKKDIEEKMSLNNSNIDRIETMVEQMVPTLKSLEEDLMEAKEEIRKRHLKEKKTLQAELGKNLKKKKLQI